MNRLREARYKLGLTQEEAASSIGVSISLLSKMEQGLKSGNDNTKIKISKFYGLSVGYLFFGEEITKRDKNKQEVI
ncbi:helix-turn-helix transcriptional regulator [Jeotgalibaca porci]|uniref:helix-turn-helix transcriptional regulator n=1 Tax=Jeotgalibaca porci TaxID=1868793 RepID=UPI0035A15F4D